MTGPIAKAWRSFELKARKVERQRRAAGQNIGRAEISLWLADPPWPLPGLPYPTLSIDRIRRLRLGPAGPSIAEASAPCCALAMFALDQFLHEAQIIGEEQGFKLLLPRIVLNKRPHTHCGGAALWAHEYLLVFVKGGALPLWLPNSVVRYSRAGLQHSQKPEKVRRILERMFPHLTNRCELFARHPAPGWKAWGDEVTWTTYDYFAQSSHK